MRRRIVMFELNEVPWRILERYAAQHPGSAVATMLASGRQFETIAEDTSLSPWITWPTLHRGVSDEEHLISDLGQDLTEVDSAYPPLWSLLVREGVSVGIGGSLHSWPLPQDLEQYAFYLPDVFAPAADTHPPEAEAFQDFNLKMSRASARSVQSGVPAAEAARFVLSAPRLGIHPRTVAGLTRHLVSERVKPWRKTRRRTWQAELSFDVFLAQLERARPAFATVFTNHVASSMHRYWAALFPDDYDVNEYDDDWRARFRDEIGWTMDRFNRMLRRLMDHAERTGAALWVASSMGQAATEAHRIHSQVLLVDVEQFMQALGLPDEGWSQRPAMQPRIVLRVDSAWREHFEARLDRIEISDRGPLSWKRLERGVYRLHPGTIQDPSDETVTVDGRSLPFEVLGFENAPVEDAANMSAYHIPEGSLIVWDPHAPHPRWGRPRVSTLDVAPSMLRELGVSPPAHMQGDASLLRS